MSQYLSIPRFDVPPYHLDKYIAPHNAYIQIGDLEFKSDKFGLTFNVPSLSMTDFASFPNFIRSIVRVAGRHRAAACAHDHGYRMLGCIGGVQLNRHEVDELMVEMMAVSNTDIDVIALIKSGLFVGGWTGWLKAKRKAKNIQPKTRDEILREKMLFDYFNRPIKNYFPASMV